ncbi:SMP-30/gluconolactonase/LRE family protein [Enhygromyxa salina]|uniref:Gluconolactonase n=1 Tax=Enhygromyxa salina TaxID=215803 RepID=A0A2S9Y5V3_9BACT|nr:SMP-30/gluconolactonase/LRE family protein [Enhygromyxa salina]PRQ00487.1 Gluconolactonase precursor [Enhygromyxa salina]
MLTRQAYGTQLLELLIGGASLVACGCREPKPAPSENVGRGVTSDSELFVFVEARPVERLRAFAEGPTWIPGRGLLFTDIPNAQMLIKGDAPGSLEVFAEPSRGAAGTSLDNQGALVVCEGNERGAGGRAVVRWSLDPAARSVIVERYEGKRFNSPNDLTIDDQGRIYFSDPHYFDDPDGELLELDVEAVYRVNADGSELLRVLGDGQVQRPNGVELSPDARTLYVTDTMIGGPALLYAFALDEQGLPTGERETVYDFGTGRGGDGMCTDARGNLYVTASAHRPPTAERDSPAGLYVFSPAHALLEAYPIADQVLTNCTFGGEANTTIYVTGAQFVWTVEARHPGFTRGSER